MCLSDKPVLEESEGPGSPPPYKMIQTIGLSVGAAVAYIIAVLGLMFYCKKRCKAKRLQKQPEGEEPEMECLNGEGGGVEAMQVAGVWALSALRRPQRVPWRWGAWPLAEVLHPSLAHFQALGRSNQAQEFLIGASGLAVCCSACFSLYC